MSESDREAAFTVGTHGSYEMITSHFVRACRELAAFIRRALACGRDRMSLQRLDLQAARFWLNIRSL